MMPSDTDAPWSPAGQGRRAGVGCPWSGGGDARPPLGASLPPVPSSLAFGVPACPPARLSRHPALSPTGLRPLWRAASPTHETPALGLLGTQWGELAGAQRGASEASRGGPCIQGEQARLAQSRAAPAEWMQRPTGCPWAVREQRSHALRHGRGPREDGLSPWERDLDVGAPACPRVTLRLPPHATFVSPAGGGGTGRGGRAAADL